MPRLPVNAVRDQLTSREAQIVSRIREQGSIRQIAEELFISPRMVKTHLCHILVKCRSESAEHLITQLASGTPSPVQIPVTPREYEVLLARKDGYQLKEIAAELGLSFKTVDAHNYNLMTKFAARNLADLLRKAKKQGILPAS